MQIRSKWGTTLVEYEYDAWGNCSIVYTHSAYGSFGEINPIRYRSYFYDFETGFYYLRSRYYDPAIRRFINTDTYISTGQNFLGFNMYAYCLNAPVDKKDVAGYVCVDCFDEDGDALDDEGITAMGSHVAGNGKIGIGYSTTVARNSNFKTFKTEGLLNQHYNKHGSKFEGLYNSPSEYLNGANYVIQNGIYDSGMNGYLRFFGAEGGANYAFVGLTADRLHITTFGIRKVKSLKAIAWLEY